MMMAKHKKNREHHKVFAGGSVGAREREREILARGDVLKWVGRRRRRRRQRSSIEAKTGFAKLLTR